MIACDTDVAIDGRALGKPADAEAARGYLDLLSGRVHEVVSGLVVLADGEERSGLERTAVEFRELDEAEKQRYVEFGEWRGRSGRICDPDPGLDPGGADRGKRLERGRAAGRATVRAGAGIVSARLTCRAFKKHLG